MAHYDLSAHINLGKSALPRVDGKQQEKKRWTGKKKLKERAASHFAMQDGIGGQSSAGLLARVELGLNKLGLFPCSLTCLNKNVEFSIHRVPASFKSREKLVGPGLLELTLLNSQCWNSR